MKYERIPYSRKDEVERELVKCTNDSVLEAPKFDHPIPIRENFERVLNRKNPMWVPSAMIDFNYALGYELTGFSDLRFNFKERCVWTDLFGCEWEWIPQAGGSMLKPNCTPVVKDITKWKESVIWPELDEERIRKCCETYMSQPYYHPDRMNYFDFGQGCTERLVAVLGGYQEAMEAFAEEPESCYEFMMALSEYHCKMLDMILKYYPCDLLMYHDDWGTERDTFFSPGMMESMVYEPTEIFFRHVQKKGIRIVFHCCGNIERFMPYVEKLAPDFLQLQGRANHMDAYKKEYGSVLGFDHVMRGIGEEDTAGMIRQGIDQFAENGGMFSTTFSVPQEALWGGLQELYWYSREYYEKNNNN